MLKKILIGIAALVLLLVVAAVALIAAVDADHYKPRIEKAAFEQLGRTLAFDGKLSLSVFPTIALALPHTTLSERGTSAPFMSLDRARVSLAVLPLLSGRLQAGTASLHGLRVTVTRHADGSTTVDDLTGKAKPESKAPESPAQQGSGGVPAQFELGGIELVDAQVTYRDEQAHNTVTLSKLNLKTGRIATRSSTPIDLSASLAATEPPSHFDLSLKAIADLDLAEHSFGARGIDAHVRGNAGADQLDVVLTAPRITVDAARAAVEQVKLLATVTGGHQARIDLTLDKLAGSADKFSVGAITGELDLESPALPQKSLKVNLDGSMRADTRGQDVVARLAAHFDETAVTSQLNVHGFSSPRIGFDVDVDRLNLDRYLSGAPTASAAAAAPATGHGPAAPATDPKVDLSALKALNLAGEVRIGALQVHNLKASKVQVAVRAAAGHLDVAPLSANLYQGSLSSNAKVDADANRIAVKADLAGISIGPLLQDLTGKDVLDGHGNVKLDVTTLGPTVGALRRALGGTASLALRDGAVHGINIAQKLRDLKGTLSTGAPAGGTASAAEKTDFSELTATFSIKGGVASNHDLLAKSPLLRVNGAGDIDVGAGALDYTVQAAVVGTLAGQGGADLSSLQGLTIPVHLSGPFTALSYQLDWSSIARQAAASKATERLKTLLGNKLNQGGQSSGSNAGDALKGLLGK